MNGTVRAHHINSDQDLELNPLELNGVYFGNLGQSMEEKDTSLTKTLPELCGLFEKLQQYRSQGLSLINSPETMLNFVSKRYLIKMSQNTDIPFIESEEVESLDHLIELSRRDRLMLVKPLISERSNGTIVLNGKTEEELKAHYDRYCKSKTQELNESLYAKVMAEQGLIAQPYTSDFADKGEVKIGIMGGKITLSRIHTLGESQEDVPIVAWGRKDTIVNIAPYSPTTEETALALRIYDIVNEQFPIHNMRVDLAGGKVSEIGH
jgi:hypothetical protein